MVTEWIKVNEVSPFTNIEMKEDDSGEVVVDMVADFESSISEAFADRTSEVLGDYITAIVQSAIGEMDRNQEADTIKEATEATEG